MKVKALCTIKDGVCTYNAGDVFETEADLGNLVEVVEAEPVKKEAEVPKEAEATETTEAPKPKSRKKKLSE